MNGKMNMEGKGLRYRKLINSKRFEEGKKERRFNSIWNRVNN